MPKSNWITRQQIRDTKTTHFYIYADDKTGKAYRGQGSEACGEENAGKVITKKWCCQTTDAYFDDIMFDLLIKPLIDRSLDEIRANIKGRIVVVFPKIGLGNAELDKRAPKTLKYIQEQLELLRTQT